MGRNVHILVILGIVVSSLGFCCIGFWPLGVICSALGLFLTLTKPQHYGWKPLAILGLVYSLLSMPLFFLVLFLIGHLIPSPADLDRDRVNIPGYAEFHDANNKIMFKQGNTVGYGNTPKAVEQARSYSESMEAMTQLFFEGQDEDRKLTMTQNKFLVYCEKKPRSTIFLVHVPELRRYKGDVRDSLMDLAWLSARTSVGQEPEQTLAVGVRGAVLYGPLYIGNSQGDPYFKGDGLTSMERIYPFFDPAKDQINETTAAEPVEAESATSE